METAKNILNQLGGNKFIAMTGANNLCSSGPDLSFSLPKFTGVSVNYIKIVLNSLDTYDIEFGRLWGTKYKTIKSLNNVYADQLRSVFTSVTGLDTSL